MAMTLDKLAGMMQDQYLDIGKDIKDIKIRLDKVEVKLDNVENKLGNVEVRLDRIEGKITNNQENRISRLEDDVRVMKTKLETNK